MAVSAVKKEPPKAQQAAPAAAPESEASPPKKKGKWLYAAIALLLLASGGGGAWWYLNRNAADSTPRAEPEKPPVFVPLEAFTVNLQQEDVSQFGQVGLTLRMSDEAAVAQLKLRMPEVRDRILLMLSARKPSELLTLDGKRKLADEIKLAVNEILAPEAVKKAAAAAAAAAQRAAAAPKPKPAPAASEPAEGQEAAQQPGEAAEATEAATETAASPRAIVLPVAAVLFTSFIIQ